MMEVRLNEQEHRLLIELLQAELTSVRSQVYHAESHDVKTMLTEREAIVRKLLEQLKAADAGQRAA